jgi:hypothetical protein
MTWNLTMDDWIVMSRCNRVAKQLLAKNYREVDSFSRLTDQRWTIDGVYPEELGDRRAPNLSTTERLRKRKKLIAVGFHTGAS